MHGETLKFTYACHLKQMRNSRKIRICHRGTEIISHMCLHVLVTSPHQNIKISVLKIMRDTNDTNYTKL